MNYIQAITKAGENGKIATAQMIEDGEFIFQGKAFVEIGVVAEGGVTDYVNASSHLNVPYANNHVVCKRTKGSKIEIGYELNKEEAGAQDWEIVD